MTKITLAATGEEIDLKEPHWAALLGWLVPGLGHLYQGRRAKGLLFMVCILGTFFYGLFLSDGRAVYASWTAWDQRLPYLCQIGVGVPAMPALVQNYLVRRDKRPWLGGAMAPPATRQERDDWYRELHRYFELGTVYTMIAGLLNILAIYDAFAGPVQLAPRENTKREDKSPEPADASSA